MAAIDIKWSELAQVAGVSLAFGVGIVFVFSLGVLGLSGGVARGGSVTRGRVLAGIAFASCAAAVGYGLYLLIPQFR